jgi:prevent-host-death family protein
MESRLNDARWQLQEAKAMFSEVVRSAAREPQFITVRGKESAVILSMDKYKNLSSRKESLSAFMQNSPWADTDLELPERTLEEMRSVNW